jgi:hypothetical protein
MNQVKHNLLSPKVLTELEARVENLDPERMVNYVAVRLSVDITFLRRAVPELLAENRLLRQELEQDEQYNKVKWLLNELAATAFCPRNVDHRSAACRGGDTECEECWRRAMEKAFSEAAAVIEKEDKG